MAPLPRWVSLTAIFLLTVAVMACIGHGVARTFIKFPPLEAYRFDILGSIAGIVAITLLAFLQITSSRQSPSMSAIRQGLDLVPLFDAAPDAVRRVLVVLVV
jgi:hypothetical protein